MTLSERTFIVRIQCTGFNDIEVNAHNQEEAKELALIEFQCDGSHGGEFVQFLSVLERNFNRD